jgi:phospholipase A1
MQKCILTLLILLSCTWLHADDESNIYSYRGIYGIVGSDIVKSQVSFMYLFFYYDKVKTYFGYTQQMFWDYYKDSKPFRDINYNPEFFIGYSLLKLYIDEWKIGYEHESNGRDGIASRGYNRYYVEIKTGYWFKYINIGTRIKLSQYHERFISYKNKDIEKYNGSLNSTFYIGLNQEYKYISNEAIYITTSIDKMSGKFCWLEYGVRFRLFPKHFTSSLYLQGYYGTCEYLLDYKRSENAIRFGILFE